MTSLASELEAARTLESDDAKFPLIRAIPLLRSKSEAMGYKLLIYREVYGRSGEIRTPDPLVPNQMRYQAALHSDAATCIA